MTRICERHGLSSHPLYNSWKTMRARCSNPNNNRFYLYGARGIRVDPTWKVSFSTFLRDVGERPAGHSLDRKNPFGNYEPNNVRWATPSMQAYNRRDRYKPRLKEKPK